MPAPSGELPSGTAGALRVLAGDANARTISLAFLLASAAGICLESLFYWMLAVERAGMVGNDGFVKLLASPDSANATAASASTTPRWKGDGSLPRTT